MLTEDEGRVMHPEPGSRWLHHSGRVYTVLFLANDVPDPQPEYPVAVVYKGENGKLWTGRLDDWHRRMSPAPAPAELPGPTQRAHGQAGKFACATKGDMYCSHSHHCDAQGGDGQWCGPPPAPSDCGGWGHTGCGICDACKSTRPSAAHRARPDRVVRTPGRIR